MKNFSPFISRSHDSAAIIALQSTCQRNLVSAVNKWVLTLVQCNTVESGSYGFLLCRELNSY